jgi:hypothetical protein
LAGIDGLVVEKGKVVVIEERESGEAERKGSD